MRQLALIVLGLCACALLAPAQTASSAPARRGWDYVVRVDERLEQMHVRLCFRQFRPKRLVLNQTRAMAALRFPTPTGGAAALRKTADGRAVEAVGLRANGCVEYQVDLRSLGGGGRSGLATRIGGDLVVAPGALFLRPGLWPSDAAVTVRIELPPGRRAAVPWTPTADGRGYVVDRYAFQLLGRIGLGRFPTDQLQSSGSLVDIAMLEGRHSASREGVHRWVDGAVRAVADLYGKFPTPRLTVLVQPTPSRGEPVVFGMAMRAGGGHVRLYLSSFARDEDLPGEWIAIHELTHLGMPWTYDQDAWFQEGFVTYYQEVLRGRAGFLTEQEAWQNIIGGFGRGRRRGGQNVLRVESRDMHSTHNYRRVYWAGAAIALKIDAALRTGSGGRRSLDDAMRLMHQRYGGVRGPNDGLELLRRVDRALGTTICAPIAERCLSSRGFPEVDPTLQSLGVRVENGRVRLDDAAPQAAHRKAIMRPGGR